MFIPEIVHAIKIKDKGERGTGNGNGERGTGNGERGTGNGERGTGNGERGTGNGERGTGTENGILTTVFDTETLSEKNSWGK